MTHLLFATRNAHKTRELAELLGSGFTITDASAHDGLPLVEETGTTFAENAVLKAATISRIVPGLVVADDSGLEVDSLGGAPGVYSARFAGEAATDSENIAKLLRELRGSTARAAQFCCVLALVREGETLAMFTGVVRGRIAEAPFGVDGFGYDPVFIPDGHEQTFAELGAAVKNSLSHRARAVAGLQAWFNKKGGEDRRP
ncbi:MAG: RdgB/HAM1 family non-canonical purine NTP pyrophosphatase [Verrucomicrobiota bacterium]|nr:RdgB/HAM1 family non-canonical purine NTP pyrophosphatase [Verrucomicrobiota bacterium]